MPGERVAVSTRRNANSCANHCEAHASSGVGATSCALATAIAARIFCLCADQPTAARGIAVALPNPAGVIPPAPRTATAARTSTRRVIESTTPSRWLLILEKLALMPSSRRRVASGLMVTRRDECRQSLRRRGTRRTPIDAEGFAAFPIRLVTINSCFERAGPRRVQRALAGLPAIAPSTTVSVGGPRR
jgi:hypothetical protein